MLELVENAQFRANIQCKLNRVSGATCICQGICVGSFSYCNSFSKGSYWVGVMGERQGDFSKELADSDSRKWSLHPGILLPFFPLSLIRLCPF